MPKQPVVEVTAVTKKYRLLCKVIETNRRYCVVELSDGSTRTLHRGDQLEFSWSEQD